MSKALIGVFSVIGILGLIDWAIATIVIDYDPANVSAQGGSQGWLLAVSCCALLAALAVAYFSGWRRTSEN